MHKDYLLPEILLDPDEGSESWHEAQAASPPPDDEEGTFTPIYSPDGEVRRYAWNGLHPGFWHGYWQTNILEAWKEIVLTYEAHPDDVRDAWLYLDCHPVFWRFEEKRRPGYPPLHIGNLKYEHNMLEGWPEITPHRVCPATNAIEDDESLNTRLQWWYEFGPWSLYPDGHGVHATHDYQLDGGSDTYEQAVLDVARKVWDNYGNDRQVVDSEEWRKGDNQDQEVRVERLLRSPGTWLRGALVQVREGQPSSVRPPRRLPQELQGIEMRCRDCQLVINPDTPVCPRCGAPHPSRAS